MEWNTRGELREYALKICLPLLERTANRRLTGYQTTVNDSAGYLLTFAESFCRPFWGIGPILKEEDFTIRIAGVETDLCGWTREVLSDAANPESPYSFRMVEGMDETSYPNQMKTELAGLMIGIWFAREKLWEPYSKADKKRIADWIYNINRAAYRVVWDCNHIWFILFNLMILKKLGFSYEDTDEILEEGLNRLDRMYVGGGFYQDGQFGRFDYYLPWSMHAYPLLWCKIAEESFPGVSVRLPVYKERVNEFLPYYTRLFDSTGCHIPFGRSLAYRFAAAVLFPLAALHDCHIAPGLARSLMMKNIRYFAEHTSTEEGILPPGFLYNAPQTVENYTSDGGAYWCVKTFLALLMPEDHPFWTAAATAPEESDFQVESGYPQIHMPLVGRKENGVTLFNNTANYLQNNKKTQFFLDMESFYSKFAYNSRSGFGISTRDNVSSDNMITLFTPNSTMESHRMGFADLGEQNGVLTSRHQPFANDSESVIITHLLPLSGGFHLRVQEVTLSQPYIIREGGFCLPQPDDYKKVTATENTLSAATRTMRSAIRVISATPVSMTVRQVHPGMHLLTPMAGYPCWQTEVCAPGQYRFITCCYLSSNPETEPMWPEIYEENGTVWVVDGGEKFRVL